MRLAWLPAIFLAACSRDPAPAPPPVAVTPEVAIDRAAAWMAAYPTDELRFDAAIGLTAIRAHHDTPALRTAYERAREVADRDGDNPLRRGFDDSSHVPPSSSAGWPIPKPGEPRANVNRIVAEAMHCHENQIRPEALAYATGPMRDGGGYQTTHALWALTIARDRGCITDFAELARPLIAELREHQPATLDRSPSSLASAIDLYAERLLMLELAGEHGPEIEAWRRRLIAAQSSDGSYGDIAPEQVPYLRYHATLVATWALSL